MIPAGTRKEIERESNRQFRTQVRIFYPLRLDRSLSKPEFAAKYREMLEKSLAPLVADPLIAFQQSVNTSLMILAVARRVSRKAYSVSARSTQVQFPPRIAKEFVRSELRILKMYGQIVDTSDGGQPGPRHLESRVVKVEGKQVGRLMIQSAFLRAFTAIEVYLQDTLAQALQNPQTWTRFSESVRDEDIPTHWEDGSRIRKFGYACRWTDVTTQLLKFPYHEFEGRVSHRFKACFGFDLKSFKQLGQLVHYRNLRHVLVHQGSVRLGIPLVDISEHDVKDLIRTGLNLADYVEARKPRSSSTQRRTGLPHVTKA